MPPVRTILSRDPLLLPLAFLTLFEEYSKSSEPLTPASYQNCILPASQRKDKLLFLWQKLLSKQACGILDWPCLPAVF